MESLVVFNKDINTEDLNKRAKIMQSYEEAMDILKQYEDIIKINKNEHLIF